MQTRNIKVGTKFKHMKEEWICTSKLKYLINYLMGLIEDEDDFEEIIIREMKALAFNEDEIIECLEYDFGLDMSWHPMSVNYGK